MGTEWVQIVQTIWPPVAGAGAALIGVYLANKHSAKRLERQLRSQEYLADKKVHRQKLEEMYELAMRYHCIMGDLLTDIQEHLPPCIPGSEGGSLTSQLRLIKEQLDPVANRLGTLLKLYVPDLVTHYANANEAHTSLVCKMFDLSIDPTNLKGKFENLQKELLEAGETIRKNITILRKALCQKMTEWHGSNRKELGYGQ